MTVSEQFNFEIKISLLFLLFSEVFESTASIFARDFNDKLLDNTTDEFKLLEKEFCKAVSRPGDTCDKYNKCLYWYRNHTCNEIHINITFTSWKKVSASKMLLVSSNKKAGSWNIWTITSVQMENNFDQNRKDDEEEEKSNIKLT